MLFRSVVCSRVGAAAEAVDAETGVLIDRSPQEAAAFAEALHGLLSDEARRAAMGAAGRRKVESEYDRRTARQAYRALFQELLEGRPG